jgi:hypothetical protein
LCCVPLLSSLPPNSRGATDMRKGDRGNGVTQLPVLARDLAFKDAVVRFQTSRATPPSCSWPPGVIVARTASSLDPLHDDHPSMTVPMWRTVIIPAQAGDRSPAVRARPQWGRFAKPADCGLVPATRRAADSAAAHTEAPHTGVRAFGDCLVVARPRGSGRETRPAPNTDASLGKEIGPDDRSIVRFRDPCPARGEWAALLARTAHAPGSARRLYSDRSLTQWVVRNDGPAWRADRSHWHAISCTPPDVVPT